MAMTNQSWDVQLTSCWLIAGVHVNIYNKYINVVQLLAVFFSLLPNIILCTCTYNKYSIR